MLALPLITMPLPLKRLITRPRIAQLGALMVKPFPAPALSPLNSTMGVPAKPGWLVPFIVTASVTAGRGESGLIVYGAGPGMLKLIVSTPGLRFASRIACLREPA